MPLKHSLLTVLLICVAGVLFAQMTPNAPVRDFRLPRFAENGYTQWVLEGAKGIYDSEEQIRVESMALRVYSGDERMAKELTLDSPQATLRIQENRAFSDERIEIAGANFKISGIGWEWIGATKEIVVRANARVEFTQAISGGLASPDESVGDRSTTIESDQLVLKTTEEEYNFEFTGSVQARSGEMEIASQSLIALVDAPEGRDSDRHLVEPEQLDSVRRIIAREDVVIVQDDRMVKAGEAEFFARERRAILTGAPQVEVAGAFLSGAVVRSRDGEVIIEGSEAEGRAQMILLETGGLGIQGAGALSSETIVLADTISMFAGEEENRFLFDGDVEVMSGAVLLSASELSILANKGGGDTADPSGEINVGEVSEMVAEGRVRIEHSGQVAESDRVTFFPAQERAVLTGSPKVTNGEAVIVGRQMELQPKLAIVSGDADQPVVVTLPEMPDLGYQGFGAGDEAPSTDVESEEAPLVETVVRSRMLRMVEKVEQTLFRFSDSVEISGTNFEASCERLDVVAKENSDSDASDQLRERLEMERIEAHDAVEITQTGRTASAKRAFILPKEGKVVLEENAVVEDERGRVSGHRMTLLQGQRRAIVEGGGAEQERARITLPALPAGD